ncbi:TKL protein kinase [Phytophthora palmivora]|uniref:TKL protein kinase n=1 Tax=Phytophthora palmivora TaxID=4796 RepID=A0A2P4XN17_9STRA|nr:TKL protein kinase [Phytophthora palmivora]
MAITPRRCWMLVVIAIVAFIYEAVEVCIAQDSGSLSADRMTSTSGSVLTSSTGSEVGFVHATTVAEELAQEWFTANFWYNDTQLAVGVDSALQNLSSSDIICSGVPSLQRRSEGVLPNFGCPDIFTAIDASCTCLTTGYNDTEVWEFHVARSSFDSEYPTTLKTADILLVDTIRTLLVPTTLKTLRIIGNGDLPQEIQFAPEDKRIPGTALPIAINPSGSIAISTVEIMNINMFSITLAASSFLPSTTTKLTLRNCNLFGFGFHFFDGVTNLQHLDLSSNSLTVPYAGSTSQSSCSNQLCAIETLNLTNNSLTTFPTVVFNIESLQELYIAQNDIADFNISNSTFNAIKSLTAFESDQPDISATCTSGTWQTAHNSKFCVANETIAIPESSSGNCNQTIVYVGVIGGCLVVALVISLLYQRARTRHRAYSASPVSSPSSYYLERSGNDTLNFQGSDNSTAESLLEDPIIITNRINYKEIKLGKCLSRGGFGLVFVGEYKDRQVAVKKIRPDRSQDPKDVKAFLKEIILMAELHHPRIVEFIGVAWDNLKHISAVTEFMVSGDLRHVLRSFKRQGSPLSWRNHKTSISLHIAEAMQYLHAHSPKVIHRDLKSKNVLLNMHLEAKLTDFGVSRTQYTVQTHAMTAGIGTSFWIAPEVLLGRDYNEQADIYSFGVVLSEIDTDDYPYWNDSNRDAARGKLQEADILRQVATGNKRPNFSSSCPAGIMLLAESCLQEKPEDRPTASAIVETLQQLVRSSLQPSSSDSSPSFASGSRWTAIDVRLPLLHFIRDRMVIDHGGLLGNSVKLCFWLFLSWSTLVAAQVSSSSSVDTSSLSTNAGDKSQAQILAQDWFEANSDDNKTYLAVGVNSALSNITNSSSGSSLLVSIAVAAGAVVILLFTIFVWMFCKQSDMERLSSSSSKIDLTRASYFDDTRCDVDAVLLDDPVIVTNRIEYKHVRLGKCISKGGFGLVFTGEYRGRRVAIKKIRPDRSGDAAEIEVFLKEIILMAMLYHPRIVEFIGVAWDNLRHLSAVTEFMDNGDLREVLYTFKEQGSPLSWETHKAPIVLHIAEALAYLHSQHPKIIHRDLKSKNVLLNLYFEAKLSDFGISRVRYAIETHMTAGVGTSFWIAPEILLGHDYDECADIYSFGVVLSEIDTDDYPYWNDKHPNEARGKIQESEILTQVAAGQLRPEFSPSCPEEILAIADACLQNNPRDRPTAAEIVIVMQDLIHPSRRRSSSQFISEDDSASIWSVQSPSNIIL